MFGPKKEVARMRLEGDDNARPVKPLRQRLGAFDHGTVSSVNAVEIADGGNRSSKSFGRGRGIAGDNELRRRHGRDQIELRRVLGRIA